MIQRDLAAQRGEEWGQAPRQAAWVVKKYSGEVRSSESGVVYH